MRQRLIYLALLTILLLVVACGEKPERHLDLGLWYYQKGLVDDAILEFKEVIRLLPADPRRRCKRPSPLSGRSQPQPAQAG